MIDWSYQKEQTAEIATKERTREKRSFMVLMVLIRMNFSLYQKKENEIRNVVLPRVDLIPIFLKPFVKHPLTSTSSSSCSTLG